VVAKDFPSIGKFATKICELPCVQKSGRVNLVGAVVRVGSVSEFERQDASAGKVLRFVLSDGTGDVSVVVWNEKVDEVVGMLSEEAGLQVVNARVKRTAIDGLEVHIDGATYVGVQPGSDFSQLASLREGLEGVNVVGEIASKPMVREVRTAKQEVLKLGTFELKDATGTMWVSAWRSHADSVKDLRVGDRIIIKNAYVKRGFGDQLELSTRNATSIVRKPDQQN
jgi:ssDNA-binding replication factor A large subunit